MKFFLQEQENSVAAHYFIRIKTARFVSYASENGATVFIRTANNNQGRQIKQAFDLINKGVDVLVVILVDQNISAEIVEKAHERDIKVIAYDRMIRKHPRGVDAVIAANNALDEDVAEAIKERELEKNILRPCQDAELNACRRIIQGSQSMTVYKPVRRLAQVASEVACKFARDEAVSTINQTTL